MINNLHFRITSSQKTIDDAYHGTKKSIALNIIKDQRFFPSYGEHLFLGTGIYFFEGSRKDAEEWAVNKYRLSHPVQVGIICATISLGKCLDLLNKGHRDILKGVANRLQAEKKRQKISDAFVVNFVATNICKEIDTVRGIFTGREVIFYGSRIPDKIQLIICVRNHTMIKSISLRQGDKK